MPKVVMVTQDWPGLGLAMMMQSQGTDLTVVYIPDSKERAKDKESHELLGNGLVQKITWDESKVLRGKDTLWLFDSNRLYKFAQELIDAGEAVIGSSKLSATMEDDRDEGVKLAKEVGFDIPFTQEFTDYGEALKFLKGEASRSFVYKPYKADPTSTFVPQAHTAQEGNKEVQAYIESLQECAELKGKPQFILQEQIFGGLETNFELWVRRGKPLLALCDLESKRKLVGDLGENIGCAGDYVYPVEINSKGVRMTVMKYLRHPLLKDYTGSVDANVIFHKNKVYFLENCFRMGFNAYATIFNGLALARVEDIFREWATGKKKLDGALLDGYGASLTVTCDHPVDGYPIMLPKANRGYYLYRAYKERGKLLMVQGWPEVLCAVAYGKTMESAGDRALALAKQVILPNKGYRIDLADSDQPYLPIPRQRKAEALGLIAY